ncbi:MAG: alginate export family protein [Candidatus Binatia bacterium]
MRTHWHRVLEVTIWSAVCVTVASVSPDRIEADIRDQVTLTLSDRVRGEFVDWFEPPAKKAPAGTQRYDFFGNQFRAGAKISVPHTLLTLEVQDTELVDLPNGASLPAPQGNLGPGAIYFANTHQRDQEEVFLKQANLMVTDLPGLTGSTTTFGRFEYSDGLETIPTDPALAWLKRARIGERLVGPFGYTHVTRSFDGARLAYDTPMLNVTAVGTRPTDGGFEISANREMDVWLAGLSLTLKQLPDAPPLDARVFYLYYEDDRTDALKADNRTAADRLLDRKSINVHTWGTHAVTVVDAGPGKIDGLLWAAVQAGEWGKLGHQGWAYAVETGYQFPRAFAQPWLRAGYNQSSGSHNTLTHATFFQIIPTARAYAQLPFYNLMNNQDLFAQLIFKPHSRVTVRSDYHWLQLTEAKDLWYSGGGATSNQFFGFAGLPSGGHHNLAHLADISFTISILKQLSAYAYYGRAFGQQVVKSTFSSGDTANYGYIELAFRY